MDISEFFSQIIELAQNGNWTGIWTLILGVFATILASVGGIAGVIAIVNGVIKLFSESKLISKILVGIGNLLMGTKNDTEILMQQNTNTVSSIVTSEINSLKNTVTNLNKTVLAMQKQSIATQQSLQSFVGTVLDTEKLQLIYGNKLKEMALNDKEEIVEQIAVVKEELPQVLEPIIETELVEVKEEIKKKIKLKKEL